MSEKLCSVCGKMKKSGVRHLDKNGNALFTCDKCLAIARRVDAAERRAEFGLSGGYSAWAY